VIVTDVTATFVDSVAAALGAVASVFGALKTGSAAATLADSTEVAVSIDVSAADVRTTAAVAGLGWILFFGSSRAGGAAGSIDTLAADEVAATGVGLGFGSAISSGRMVLNGPLMLATSVCWDSWRAAISTAPAMTQIAPAKTARTVSARTAVASVIGSGLFERVDRVAFLAFLAFFAGTDILLSESFWSFRSAESTYRIDRGGLDGLFTRTDILLGETRWNSGVS
jgi:hypothetical protein